jgi:hypothetical protein
VYYRYRFWTQRTSAEPTAAPPDAFLVFLLDGNGERYPIFDDTNPDHMGFTKAVQYADSDGELRWSAPNPFPILIGGPDWEGFYDVALDVSSLQLPAGTPMQIEFGLACAANDMTSFVYVDSVLTECDYEDGDPACEFCPRDNDPNYPTQNKVSALTMFYTGDDCDTWRLSWLVDPQMGADPNDPNSETGPWDCTCYEEGESLPAGWAVFVPGTSPVYIVVSDKDYLEPHGNQDPPQEYFEGNVYLDQAFTADSAIVGADSLHADTYVHILDPTTGRQLIRLKAQTACSLPLLFGDQYGPLLIVGMQPEGPWFVLPGGGGW